MTGVLTEVREFEATSVRSQSSQHHLDSSHSYKTTSYCRSQQHSPRAYSYINTSRDIIVSLLTSLLSVTLTEVGPTVTAILHAGLGLAEIMQKVVTVRNTKNSGHSEKYHKK